MATHLKGLAKKGQTKRRPCQSCPGYKARVASLTSERSELRDWVQRMTEEAVKLKSDLKHTMSARARAEGRENEARDSLKSAEGELREVRDELQAAQNDLLEAKDGL